MAEADPDFILEKVELSDSDSDGLDYEPLPLPSDDSDLASSDGGETLPGDEGDGCVDKLMATGGGFCLFRRTVSGVFSVCLVVSCRLSPWARSPGFAGSRGWPGNIDVIWETVMFLGDVWRVCGVLAVYAALAI
jgi:hypothetical protein